MNGNQEQKNLNVVLNVNDTNGRKRKMLCHRCGKREQMPNDPFCVVCDEMLFESRIEEQTKHQEEPQADEEWENIGIEEVNND